jgi:hypothetical protein
MASSGTRSSSRRVAAISVSKSGNRDSARAMSVGGPRDLNLVTAYAVLSLEIIHRGM